MNSAMPTSPVTEVAQHERLVQLYENIMAELTKLHAEGFILEKDIHEAINKEKIEGILASIKKMK